MTREDEHAEKYKQQQQTSVSILT